MDRQLERVRHRAENLVILPSASSYYARLKLHKSTPPLLKDLAIDIIHLHWVSQWLDLPSFLGGIPKHIPLVWTIHDMSPLAGGCYMDFGCSDLARGCLKCPLLKAPFNQVLPRREFLRRQRALSGRRIFAVGNSINTTQIIRKSALFRDVADITTINPAVNVSDFIVHDKAAARRLLGIAPDRFVLGFGAASLTDENKGFNRFLDVAEKVGKQLGSIDALVFGEGISAAARDKVNVHSLGKISSPKLQSLLYSAMDVFVVASRMETFGQVAIEAQACSTPVWAFDVGGLPEALQTGLSGQLIPFADTAKMAESICTSAKDKRLLLMGQNGAKWVRDTFSTEQMAESYLSIYRQALAP
jgi:glycosyltransferase involved in cell wall biosynthesis